MSEGDTGEEGWGGGGAVCIGGGGGMYQGEWEVKECGSYY